MTVVALFSICAEKSASEDIILSNKSLFPNTVDISVFPRETVLQLLGREKLRVFEKFCNFGKLYHKIFKLSTLVTHVWAVFFILRFLKHCDII